MQIGQAEKKEGIKVVVLLKYLSNFWRSLEMPLHNCKVELSLRWSENCVLSNVAGNSALSTEDNAKLSKSLTEGFKR